MSFRCRSARSRMSPRCPKPSRRRTANLIYNLRLAVARVPDHFQRTPDLIDAIGGNGACQRVEDGSGRAVAVHLGRTGRVTLAIGRLAGDPKSAFARLNIRSTSVTDAEPEPAEEPWGDSGQVEDVVGARRVRPPCRCCTASIGT